MGFQRGQRIITDDLRLNVDATASFRANERSSWPNLVSNNDNGTFANDASFGSDPRGAFIELDGTNDYIDFGDISWVDTTDLTLSFAARLTGGSYSNDQDFITKGNHSSTRPLTIWYDIHAGSDPSVGSGNEKCLSVIVRGSNNDERIWISGPTDSIKGDKDFAIDIVIDTTNKRVHAYKDGELLMESAANSDFVGIKAVTSTLRLGIDTAGTKDMQGRFYYFRIYERCLSADEIKKNYNAVKGRFT
tara:strand:+ start:829 stop:1569 length:741 start_codon:yes stop_codon:yes gene_type:complete